MVELVEDSDEKQDGDFYASSFLSCHEWEKLDD